MAQSSPLLSYYTCHGLNVSSFGLQREIPWSSSAFLNIGLPWEPSAWCPGSPLDFVRAD